LQKVCQRFSEFSCPGIKIVPDFRGKVDGEDGKNRLRKALYISFLI
jgi:hypothetical protein